MYKVTNIDEIETVKENKLLVNKDKIVLSNSKILISGKDNIIVIEDGCKLLNTNININGNGNLVYLSSNKNNIMLNLSIFNNSTCYIGKNVYFNGTLNVILSEEKNFLVGSDCLFSFGIWVRTADPHLIYDAESKVRINHSKSVLIGEHCWIGQAAMLLKGCEVGSGSIIGGGAVLSKRVGNNEIYAGNPAKKIKEGIFWSGECVHTFTDEKTKKYNVMNKSDYIFSQDNILDKLKHLDAIKTSNHDKLDFIQQI